MSPREGITEGIGWREHPGDGPLLLALHGIGAEARAFDALAERLPGWRVIAWEAPGYGPSAPLPMDWPRAADYAQALARLVAVLGLPRFHLLGHSLGTLIAAAYARRHPVQTLTLAACAQGGGAVPGTLPPSQQARLDDLDRLGAPAMAEARAPRLIHQPERNPALVAAVAQGMGRIRRPGYAQAVRMLASGDLAADCAAQTQLTQVIVGAEDLVTPPAQSQHAHDALPPAHRGALTLIPACGHALHQQAPQALAHAILQGATP